MTDPGIKNLHLAPQADTLSRLHGKLKKCTIPNLFHFTVKEWHDYRKKILETLKLTFKDSILILTSSPANEDSSHTAMAGEYLSIPNISSSNLKEVIPSLDELIDSYSKLGNIASMYDQILIQEMALDVSMSGVLFTKDMNSRPPYYVIHYDDETWRTDTISSGTGYSNKTLYIHREYGLTSLKSERFLSLIEAENDIESVVSSDMLDIEFAIDNLSSEVDLLQVRTITTHQDWIDNIDSRINQS
jgi:Pyruvate phosphate dikinase, PEP/pyruvate binding domain.